MRLPAWDELIDEQRDVLDEPLDQSLFVVGPPGSGKTSLAVHRARQVAALARRYGRAASQQVAIVTFNRMLRRLMALVNKEAQLTYTMHRFLWQDYRRRTSEDPPHMPYDTYAPDWQAIFKTLSKHPNNRPARSHMVIDEGQDLPPEFFRYASRFAAKTLTVFADENQAVTENRTSLAQIKAEASLDDPLLLEMNHRNSPEVARLARRFFSGRLPVASVSRAETGELPRLIRSTGLDATAERISNWCETRGGTVGIVVHDNKVGRALYKKLVMNLPRHRVDLYDSQRRNEDSIKLLEPGVTVLNRRSVKGQEFDAVFILQLELFVPCTSDAARRVMYMLCARARDHLFLVSGPNQLSRAALASLPGPTALVRE